jgi:carboxyl-terminal processing protease
MKAKYLFCLLLFTRLSCYTAQAQLPDSIKTHIDSCLAILETHSLYSPAVNWKKTRQAVLHKAKSATTKAGVFEALKIAFNALGDKHAQYYHYNDQYKLANDALMSRYTDSIRTAWLSGPSIVQQMIHGIAYLRVPFMGVNRQKDIDERANALYRAVVQLQEQAPTGWIIDLRLNGGGNIRPMLAGLAAFFGDGIVSYYTDHLGQASDESSFKEGRFLIDGVQQADIANLTEGFPQAKVAVLIGAGTASSGELTAAIFKQRNNTKVFGESSAGLANATAGFVLGEEVYFLISTARIADRHKQPLPEVVTPDIMVKGNDAFHVIEQDITVNAALRWLQQPF